MRISNAMVAENIKAYLFKHTEQLLKTQEQIGSGKRINRPSDDPIGMGQVLAYRKSIAKLDQYNSNITNAKFHIDTVEDILGGVTEMLMDAKRIASDLHPEMRSMLADQVATIREQVLQMANSRNNGNHVFSGDMTDTQPFVYDPVAGTYSYMGDHGTKDYSIGEGLNIGLEADGSKIFGDVFQILSDLEAELRNDNASGITNQLPLLETAIQRLNSTRAVNAGKHQRLVATEKYNSRFKVNAEELLSRTEDTDIAAAAIDLKIQQVAYESTLATAAKIVQPSLIDFLR
ncbi:MAG: flagellar hook-associated protein 3 [Desulfobacteraceae bacterium]|nr:MAG: flagellar hook-associated protein 3 [Desulfobacteraceae bacterium]